MSAATIGKSKAPARRSALEHPHVVPILGAEDPVEDVADQPFAEGALDTVDPDLRHRMISEAAYRRYVERGYSDGDDFDDWLEAETEIDHLLVNRSALPQGSTR
jgi:hypothetical protein